MPTIYTYADTNLPTPDEIRRRWCFGLSLTKVSDGGAMPDADLQTYIDAAVQEVERRLGIFLKPVVIATKPEERGLVLGTDYERSEPAYDYNVKDYRHWGFLQLRQRPVIKINTLKLMLPNGMEIVDFTKKEEWIKLYKKSGQLHIVPYAGDPSMFAILGGSQVGYPFVTGQLHSRLPQMFYVDYVAGYDIGEIPADIANIVAKLAAIDALGIAGDAVLAGIASLSTSIDGLSESLSTTASATNSTYSAHILQYQKEVDSFFNPKKGSGRSAERGITMTGLGG